MDMTLLSVKSFHDVFGLVVAEEPDIPMTSPAARMILRKFVERMERLAEDLKTSAANYNSNLLLLRLQLCQEELAELGRAMEQGNVVDALDALCDMRYVADGTTIALGLHHAFLPAFREIHDSNMSKLGEDGRPIISEAGRVVKGPNYWRPQLKRFLP